MRTSILENKMSTWQKLGTCVSLFVSVTVTVTCLCWSLAHAEQLLFSCLCSKVSICNYVTCHMSNTYVDPRDMLINFSFHVYAQKWVFVIMSHVTCCMSHVACHMSHVTCRMSHVLCQMLMLILGTCWTTFVFMCKIKSEYL